MPIFLEKRIVNVALRTTRIKGSSVLDKEGSPLNVSVVITYVIKNSLASVFNVEYSSNYLES